MERIGKKYYADFSVYEAGDPSIPDRFLYVKIDQDSVLVSPDFDINIDNYWILKKEELNKFYRLKYETPKQSPSIGQIVLYQKFGTADGTHKSEPSPAIITKVHDNNECDLFVINPNGLYFNRTKFSEELKGGCWSWPKIKTQEYK